MILNHTFNACGAAGACYFIGTLGVFEKVKFVFANYMTLKRANIFKQISIGIAYYLLWQRLYNYPRIMVK